MFRYLLAALLMSTHNRYFCKEILFWITPFLLSYGWLDQIYGFFVPKRVDIFFHISPETKTYVMGTL